MDAKEIGGQETEKFVCTRGPLVVWVDAERGCFPPVLSIPCPAPRTLCLYFPTRETLRAAGLRGVKLHLPPPHLQGRGVGAFVCSGKFKNYILRDQTKKRLIYIIN